MFSFVKLFFSFALLLQSHYCCWTRAQDISVSSHVHIISLTTRALLLPVRRCGIIHRLTYLQQDMSATDSSNETRNVYVWELLA